MARTLLRIFLLVLLVAVTGTVHARVPSRTHAERGESFIPRPELARATALGFDAILSDYYWLWAVQAVGGTLAVHKIGGLLGRLIDVVTTLDPWVDHPYRFAAVWLTHSVEEVQQANRLLERSIAHHPDEWRNRFYLGFNHFFYLGDDATAAELIHQAAQLPGAPAYLNRLAARLRFATEGLDTAETFLREMVRGAEDGYARAEYEKALDEIETERRARRLDEARAEYHRRHGRDIQRVEDLVEGSDPVLEQLPPEIHGWEWVIDDESGEIVSSWYERRYVLHMHDGDRKRRERWSRLHRSGAETQP